MKKLFLIPLVFSSLIIKAEETNQSERELYCNQLLNNINALKELQQPVVTDDVLKRQYRFQKSELNTALEEASLALIKLKQTKSLEAKELIAELGNEISNKILQIIAQKGYTYQEKLEEIKSLIDNAGTQPILEKAVYALEENIKLIDNQLKNFPSEEKFIAAHRNKFNKKSNGINNQIKLYTELYNYCIHEKSNSELNGSTKPHQRELKLAIPKLFKAS